MLLNSVKFFWSTLKIHTENFTHYSTLLTQQFCIIHCVSRSTVCNTDFFKIFFVL